MNWSLWYRARSRLRSSLWTIPILTIPFALAATRLFNWLDTKIEWKFLDFGVAGARSMLDAITAAALVFMVFTFSSLLIAIQVASGTLTPRIIAPTLLQNNIVRNTVGLFIFTWLFANGAQNRIDGTVHQFPLFIAAALAVLSFAAFFYLIDYASRLLRPIAVLTHVGNNGLRVIREVYPEESLGPGVPDAPRHQLGSPTRVILHQGSSGIVLAVELTRLMREAELRKLVIEFVPQVGDFVAIGEPLFNIYGDASIEDDVLYSTVAFGSERTMEQDPAFALRIVVDIALKALSPAINDPTTAVLAIDQLHRLLRLVGTRHLRTDEVLGKADQLRVICRTPNWEDFVYLAFSEIRAYGAGNLQVARRLRAMIENLMQTLPSHRLNVLQRQLDLLDRFTANAFQYPEELALARIADSQGLGGHSGKEQTRSR